MSRESDAALLQSMPRAAHRMIAFVIWEVGLPRMIWDDGAPAAEQRDHIVRENTIAILQWLDGAARSILLYKETWDYQEAQRKAGRTRGDIGLTPAEQAEQKELKKAQKNVQKGMWLAKLWNEHAVTFHTMTSADWALLQNHWNGSDVQRVNEIQRKRGNKRITMPAIWQ